MLQIKLWASAIVIFVSFAVGFLSGYHVRDAEAVKDELKHSKQAVQSWVDKFTLQGQLATRDQQLAEAQAASGAVRTETVIKREVVYREKIADVTVAKCVHDSGVLDVYDATLGLSDPAK